MRSRYTDRDQIVSIFKFEEASRRLMKNCKQKDVGEFVLEYQGPGRGLPEPLKGSCGWRSALDKKRWVFPNRGIPWSITSHVEGIVNRNLNPIQMLLWNLD